jgi:regulator of nucleoside diphosphate kinase
MGIVIGMRTAQSRCCVTAKDFIILENMIRQSPPYSEGLIRLLRRKLSTAIVVLPEDIAPHIATIDSRVEYRIDGGRTECCVLVHGEGNSSRGLALPISMLRGLALLGLSEGNSISIERLDGRVETVSLEKIAYQPESARRAGLAHSSGGQPHSRPGGGDDHEPPAA